MGKTLFTKQRKPKFGPKRQPKSRAKKVEAAGSGEDFSGDKHSAISNSGVFRSAGVDWLTFSMPESAKKWKETLLDIARMFHVTVANKVASGHGYKGYALSVFGSLTWRGTDIKVDFPGLAMQFVRENLGLCDNEIIQWFLNRRFKVTRIDIALDTDHPKFNPLIALNAYRAGNTRCDAGTWDFRIPCVPQGRQIFPREGRSMTTYVGSPMSARRVRIYDRKAKLEKFGQEPKDIFGRVLDRITRIEMQARDEAAEAIALEVARGGYGVIPPLIGAFLTFLDGSDDRQRRRKQVAPYWQDIIGPVGKKLPRLRTPTPPEKTKKWLDEIVAPSLKAVKVYDPERYELLLKEKVPLAEINPVKEEKWAVSQAEMIARKEEQAELLKEELEGEFLARLELDRRKANGANAQKPDETK